MSQNCINLIASVLTKQELRTQKTRRPDTLEELYSDLVELEPHILKLIDLQSTSPYPNEELLEPKTPEQIDECMEKFVEWMRQNDPKTTIGDLISFQRVKEGFGIVANRKIAKDEEVIVIPRKLMISYEDAIEPKSKLSLVVKNNPILKEIPSLVLTLHLIYERLNPKSFFTPYLDVLPSVIDLPMFCTLDDLAVLKGSHNYFTALRQYKTSIQQYIRSRDIIKKANKTAKKRLQDFSFNTFRWAMATMMARQNSILSDKFNINSKTPPTFVLALIPGFDMVNHAHMDGVITTNYDIEDRTSVTVTPVDVEVGEQVYVFYGERPNSQLFLYQGFIDEGSMCDRITFSLPPLFAHTPHAEVRAKVLSEMSIFQSDFSVPFTYSTDAPIPKFHRTPLNAWRDIWKSIYIRTCDVEALEKIAVEVPELMAKFKTAEITEEVKNTGYFLFQDDCEGDVREVVVGCLRESLEATLAAFPDVDRDTSTNFKANAAKLIDFEKNIIQSQLQKL